ncbi:MAG: hypothetical protein WC725_04560 [Patescibacteria group bacterium]|jgi:hypothetical protein
MENESSLEIKKLNELADKLEELNGGKEIPGALGVFVKLLRVGKREEAVSRVKNELFDKLTDEERKIIGDYL